MKRPPPQIDPLEETLENPDLPPIVAGRADLPLPRGAVRRAWRRIMLVGAGAVAVLVAIFGLHLAG